MFWSFTNSTAGDQTTFADRELYSIKTQLTQEGRIVMIETECDGYLDGLTNRINNMGMAISTYDAGQVNDISNDQCASACSEATTKISNIKWSNNNAWTYVPDEDEEEEDNTQPGELIIDDVA